MNLKKTMTITISIYVIFIGLIITAIGGLIYNYKSTTSTNESFKNAEGERIELKNKLNQEFLNASKEMQLHKDSLNKKVEDEATQIITQLKEKSAEAKKALDNLKEQSNKASTDISLEVTKLKEVTEKELEKLSYPTPSEFIATSLIVIIKPEALKGYLPELREKFNSDSLLNKHYGKGKYLNRNFPLNHEEVNSNLLNIFEGEEIHISLQIGDKNGPYNNDKRALIWTFDAKIFLNDKTTHLLYFIDYENKQKEYFRLSLGNDEKRLDSNGRLRLFGGLKSALELCGQTVHVGFQVGNNQTLLPPLISIQSLQFRDNNSKDYYIKFDGTTTVRHNFEVAKKQFPEIDIAPYHDVIYLSGKINCTSF